MAEALVEPDRLAGAPHPREQLALFGHAHAEQAFLEGWRAGRLHHAWLIGGPQGVGKATLAYRIARFLLARGGEGEKRGDLTVSPGHPAARQVAALSHPDMAVVRRGLRKDGKRYSAEIAVDDVRRALDLFGAAASAGGYRVCIVDSADDLNASGANALLKLVEEPPPLSVFVIVAHAPQRLLPTIRSRCRRLQLRPLDEASLRAAVRSLGPPWREMEEGPLARAIALADGSVRRAVVMLDEGVGGLAAEVSGILAELPRLDLKRVLVLAESLQRRDGQEAYAVMLDIVLRWASRQLDAKAHAGPVSLAPLVEVCEKVARAASEVDEYNLDRRPLVIAMFGDLAEAVRRTEPQLA
jgi:DNA polymerase-3 subunit delta'